MNWPMPCRNSGLRCAFLLWSLTSGFLLSAPRDQSPSQDYVVRVWGADEGLPVNSVTDIAQTPEGYLWIGTLLAGVLRFDGRQFVSFSAANTPELRSMSVRHLMVDSTGTLWIVVFNDTLATWDRDGFKFAMTNTCRPTHLLWSAPGRVIFLNADNKLLCGRKLGTNWNWEFDSLPSAPSRIQCCADQSGRIWYVGKDQALRIWEDGNTRSLLPAPGLENQPIKVMTADASGRIWVGTDQGLASWQGNRFEAMTPTNGETRLSIRRIVPSGKDSLWVEAGGRMRRCENRRWLAECEAWPELGSTSKLWFVQGDPKDGLWSDADDLGLIHVESNGALRTLTTQDGLPSDSVRLAFSDREGNLWTGYERGGLVQVRPRLFRVIGKDEGLQESVVTSVCADSDGSIWVGTLNGDIARCKDGRCTNLALPAGMRLSSPTVATDVQGRLWIGTKDGVLLADKVGHFRKLGGRQLREGVRLMLPTRDGKLWVGLLDAIQVIVGDRVLSVYTAHTVSAYPAALAEDSDGTVWAGTFGRHLLRWDGQQFVREGPPIEDFQGRFWALCASHDGGLWIGTSSGGLLKWRAGEFRRYTTKDGLPSDSILQMQTDDQGNLWLVTRAGIVRVSESTFARFDRGELNAISCSVYGRWEGLLTIGGATEFQPNCCRAKDGSLWFAMDNGVAGVRPEEARINPLPPTVVLEQVVVGDQPLWPPRLAAVSASLPFPGAAGQIVPQPSLDIGPDRRDLAFHYTGLSFNSPNRVRFKYRLEGLDDRWTDAGSAREAIYRYVPPGQYKFQVIGCNSDGVWNNRPAEVAVRVEPYFYQTTWFLGGAGLAAVLGVAFIVRATTRHRLSRRLEQVERQRELEQERTRIAQDLHDDLGVGLTEIGLLGDLACASSTAPATHQEYLHEITSRARGLAGLLDEIVWAINPANDSSQSLGDFFSQYAQTLLRRASIRCRLEVACLPVVDLNAEQRHQVFLAFKEALNNVIRHSGATEVRIQLTASEASLIIRVSDNGRGFETPAGQGSPDGLLSMYQRLQRLDGQCVVVSAAGSGTSVAFFIPVGHGKKA
jgi:ligand-binding sensor domain-containing protein/signal transduction histidine kinase